MDNTLNLQRKMPVMMANTISQNTCPEEVNSQKYTSLVELAVSTDEDSHENACNTTEAYFLSFELSNL